MGDASRRAGRHCASRPREISPARSSTFRCWETAGRLISKGSASVFTDASPSRRRDRMARRGGSANAENTAFRRSSVSGRSSYLRVILIKRLLRHAASVNPRHERASPHRASERTPVLHLGVPIMDQRYISLRRTGYLVALLAGCVLLAPSAARATPGHDVPGPATVNSTSGNTVANWSAFLDEAGVSACAGPQVRGRMAATMN